MLSEGTGGDGGSPTGAEKSCRENKKYYIQQSEASVGVVSRVCPACKASTWLVTFVASCWWAGLPFSVTINRRLQRWQVKRHYTQGHTTPPRPKTRLPHTPIFPAALLGTRHTPPSSKHIYTLDKVYLRGMTVAWSAASCPAWWWWVTLFSNQSLRPAVLVWPRHEATLACPTHLHRAIFVTFLFEVTCCWFPVHWAVYLVWPGHPFALTPWNQQRRKKIYSFFN